MKYLTQPDIKRLSRLCEQELHAMEAIRDNKQAAPLERALADNQACWMRSLISRLDQIADGKTRRIEITI